MDERGWMFTKPEWCEFIIWYRSRYKGRLHGKDYMQYWRYKHLIDKWRKEVGKS